MTTYIIHNFLIKCVIYFKENNYHLQEAYEEALLLIIQTSGNISVTNPVLPVKTFHCGYSVDSRETLECLVHNLVDLKEVIRFKHSEKSYETIMEYVNIFEELHPYINLYPYVKMKYSLGI